ncbi:Hypothetical predicted protein [Mytilus galloprovincialis]|uniref:CCHC-type domain-containing protein n=2 Tax=Mytilus TaxID=6548 RepID=A0A8B6EZB3_MYTGA|nr:Hypothetical predicted protein [Mytilus galloprovincialis]
MSNSANNTNTTDENSEVNQTNDKNNMADTIETYSSILQKQNTKNNYDVEDVKPVFILETDLFGNTKPSRDQFLTHIELYKTIDATICPASHLKGLQRVRGLWRIYFDSDIDRESLITSGITIRNKYIQVYSRNPRIIVNERPTYLKVRVKNVPCSAEDGQIERSLEYHGCEVIKMYRERLRVDGLLSNCQTGDRIAMVAPLSKALPRSVLIGKYRATVIHQGQENHNQAEISCNKCLKKGHKFSQCPNDWVCLHCNKQGHRQAECNSHLSESDDTEDDNSDEDKSETEDSVQTSQSILQPIPNDSQTVSAIAPLSNDQTDTSTNKSADNDNTYMNNHDSGLEAINTNTPIDGSHKKKKKKKLTNNQKKTLGDISQYFQGTNQTPRNKTDKRNATTPTEEYQERTGPAQKTFKP